MTRRGRDGVVDLFVEQLADAGCPPLVSIQEANPETVAELEASMGRFVTVSEPLLLVVMGIVIAVLLLALYMPVFELSSVVGG